MLRLNVRYNSPWQGEKAKWGVANNSAGSCATLLRSGGEVEFLQQYFLQVRWEARLLA